MSHLFEYRPTQWPVSESAKHVMNTERISTLAQHKEVHRDFMPYRSLGYAPSCRKRSAPAENPHLTDLAQPKPHKVWHNKDENYVELGVFCDPIWPVESDVLNRRCSARVETLAGHRVPHNDYKGERSVQWSVSDNAKNSTATLRMQQLARPKSGRLRVDDYDPYKVSPAARLARVTPRVTDLSLPIPRKVRQKKMWSMHNRIYLFHVYICTICMHPWVTILCVALIL